MINELSNSVPLSVFIGLRYLRAKKSNRSISFFSFISLVGLSLGVASIIVVISVMNGFEKEMHKRILGMLPHVSIENIFVDEKNPHTFLQTHNWQRLADDLTGRHISNAGIVAAAPYIQVDGMLSKDSLVKGIRVVGVLPESEIKVSVVDDFMIAGSLSLLEEGSHKIILGDDLARELGLIVGDVITLIFPKVNGQNKKLEANYYSFEIGGFFNVGAEADEFLAFIHLADASQLKYHSDRIDGVRLKLADVYSAENVEKPLAKYLQQNFLQESGEYVNEPSNEIFKIDTWVSSYGQLFQTVKLEKVMTASMLMLIVLVAAFNTISSLNMLVAEKHTSVAVLRTMGYSEMGVVMIFLTQGFLISFFGVLSGAFLGVCIAIFLPDIILSINNSGLFWIAPLVSELKIDDVTLISGCAFLISLLASILPSLKAARIAPADAVRYR